MIHEIEQDRDWYCVIWYDDNGTMEDENFIDEGECKSFLQEKRSMGLAATAYYNTELSWVLDW